MTTIFIKGLGLIGSSLARALKQKNPTQFIYACDTQADSLNYALAEGIIDQVSPDLELASKADFIILASPVSQIIADIEALSQMDLKPEVLVTDVGSTKATILAASKVLSAKGVKFIGGHPMAGSHKTGVRAGRADLFENAFYFQIPGPNVTANDLGKMQELLSETKVKWLQLKAIEHDKIVAQISHLPHVLASALVNQTEQTFVANPLALRLAAGGFKSMTRIAAADSEMWSAIMLNNREIIVQQLQAFLTYLTTIKAQIEQGQKAELEDFFHQAQVTRQSLGPQKFGALSGFYDLFVNIPDQVGSLAEITQLLAQAQINLVNMHILEIREDIDGVLQLTFSSQANLEKAQEILTAKYQILKR